MTENRPPKPRRRALAKTRTPTPRKRTTLIATVPTPGGSPRRYYDVSDESALEIARRIVADKGNDSSDDEAAIPQEK